MTVLTTDVVFCISERIIKRSINKIHFNEVKLINFRVIHLVFIYPTEEGKRCERCPQEIHSLEVKSHSLGSPAFSPGVRHFTPQIVITKEL